MGSALALPWRHAGQLRGDQAIAARTTTIAGQPPLSYFDLTIGYAIPDSQTRLNLTVSNLLSTTPPTVGAFVGTTNQGEYSALGRVYLVTLDQKL